MTPEPAPRSYRDPWPEEPQAPLVMDARRVDPILCASIWDAVLVALRLVLWPFGVRGKSPRPPGHHQFFVEKWVGGDHLVEYHPSHLCRFCGVEKSAAWRGDGSDCPLRRGWGKLTGPAYIEALTRRAALTTGDSMLDRIYVDAARSLQRKAA